MREFVPFLLDTVLTPSNSSGASSGGTSSFGGLFSSSNPVMIIVVYCVALVVIMYFLSVRPTQKREKKLAEMRNSVEIGDSIVTNSGFYGKVVDTTYDCFIVEFGLNKGVRVPVAKTEIYSKAEPNMSNEAPPHVEEPKKRGLFGKG